MDQVNGSNIIDVVGRSGESGRKRETVDISEMKAATSSPTAAGCSLPRFSAWVWGVSALGFQVQGSGFRVRGSGFI
jgi:hypothetical protein